MIKEQDTVSNFVREKKSKALLNLDEVSLISYKKQRQNAKKFNDLNAEVSSLKSDLAEIKNMLKILTNGKAND